jgi:hypothetical protein
VAIPLFGVLANLACMLFYLVGPFTVSGMSMTEPFLALGVAGVWGIYGAWYFVTASKAKGQKVLVGEDYLAARKAT